MIFDTVYDSQNPHEGAKRFLKELLDKEVVDAVLTLATTQWSSLPMPSLFVQSQDMDRIMPLAPVAPFNAARQAAQVLRESNEKRVAVVLKPCEVRAFIELAKLNQCVVDENTLIISMECVGRLENADYIKAVETDPNAVSSLKDGSALESGVTESCRICTRFVPEENDITFLVFSGKGAATQLRASSDKGKFALEQLELELTGVDGEISAAVQARSKEKQALEQENLEAVRTATQSVEGLQTFLKGCLNCYNCRNACPVCYCRECVFKTDVFDAQPELLFKRAEKKGGIKLPQDTTMFHMTRMLHIAHACVQCGQCSSACPMDIPVADIFRASAETMQDLYNYRPGRDRNEPIPMLAFGAIDGKQEN